MIPDTLDAIHWRVFGVLLAGGIAGSLAALPYLLAIASANPGMTRGTRPELSVIVLVTAVQSAILLAIAIGAGLILAHQVGLRAPLLEQWLAGGAQVRAAQILLPALAWALGTGATLVLVDVLLFARSLPVEFHPMLHIALWKRLLAGVVYGGVTEELLTRLFLVSLLGWGLGRFWKAPSGLPEAGAFWAAIVFAALLFGVLHLPMTAAIAPLSPILVLRALLLNGIAGIIFGFLFWRYGLEAAMVAHASAHLVLQPGFVLIRMMI